MLATRASDSGQITLSKVQRADAAPRSLSKAIFYPRRDPEVGILSRALCCLECFSADTLPVSWNSVCFSFPPFVKVDGGEKPLFFLPQRASLLVAPEACSKGLLELLKPKLSLHTSVILHCHICSKTDLQGFLGRAAAFCTIPHLPAFGR